MNDFPGSSGLAVRRGTADWPWHDNPGQSRDVGAWREWAHVGVHGRGHVRLRGRGGPGRNEPCPFRVCDGQRWGIPAHGQIHVEILPAPQFPLKLGDPLPCPPGQLRGVVHVASPRFAIVLDGWFGSMCPIRTPWKFRASPDWLVTLTVMDWPGQAMSPFSFIENDVSEFSLPGIPSPDEPPREYPRSHDGGTCPCPEQHRLPWECRAVDEAEAGVVE